ncbi:MAG: hypothetical protein Q8Q52_03125 [Acidimicrobiia bacterium]|nr:hypothetical protein [Acidimicrobiia bacterium]
MTVEPFQGDSGVGPVFGTGVEIRCRFRTTRKVLRSSAGDEVVADAVLECRDSETIGREDRVTKASDVYRVYQVKPAEGPHTATNHLVVWLRAD